MNRLKGLSLVLVFAAAFAFVLAPAASAQALDGKWFKVNCKCTTQAINDAGNHADYNFSFNVYFHFSYSGPGPAPRGSVYDYQIWSQIAPDVWKITSSATGRTTNGLNESFFSDWGMSLAAKNGSVIFSFNSPFVSVEPGIFRSGGEIFTGQDPQGRTLIGWVLMNGSLVNKPPFNPVD